jgi:hypothetical protein
MPEDFQRVSMAEFDADLSQNLSEPSFGSALCTNDIANVLGIDFESQYRSGRIGNFLNGYPGRVVHERACYVCDQFGYFLFRSRFWHALPPLVVPLTYSANGQRFVTAVTVQSREKTLPSQSRGVRKRVRQTSELRLDGLENPPNLKKGSLNDCCQRRSPKPFA